MAVLRRRAMRVAAIVPPPEPTCWHHVQLMKSNGLSFHHPVAFWAGCAALTGGVLAHMPMLMHASHMHYRMAGMPMDTTMMVGMALIPIGLLLAGYGLMPRLSQLRQSLHGTAINFHIA